MREMKFRLVITVKEGTDYNPIHQYSDRKIGYWYVAKVGERGYIKLDSAYDGSLIHTSEIQDIVEDDNCVMIETLNTYYYLYKMED